MSELLQVAFSGDGAVILQLIGIGVGSWIGCSILTALGRGSQAKFVMTAATFVSIGLAITAITKIIIKIM